MRRRVRHDFAAILPDGDLRNRAQQGESSCHRLQSCSSRPLFGGYYALNPAKAESRLAMIHFWVYTLGVAALVPSLYLLLKGFAAIEPLVAFTSLVIFAGVIVFAVIVFRSPVPRTAMTPAGLR
jgi:hypothetical protein